MQFLGLASCPWRFHRCSSWARLSSCPLRADSAGVRQCRKLWNFLSCSAVMVVDVPVYAETGGLFLEVPQTLFIARAGGLSSFRAGVSTWADGDEGLGAHHTGDELN